MKAAATKAVKTVTDFPVYINKELSKLSVSEDKKEEATDKIKTTLESLKKLIEKNTTPSNPITNVEIAKIYDEIGELKKLEITNIIIDVLEKWKKGIQDNKDDDPEIKINDEKRKRAKQVIQTLTKLNTTPFIDPVLGRFVDIFFPDVVLSSTEGPAQKIYNKTTEFKLSMYPNPVFGPSGEQPKYGQSFLTRSEKFDNPFDQALDDIFGIELFMQTLMNTGSNIEKLEEYAKPRYDEVYTIKETKDKSMFYEKN